MNKILGLVAVVLLIVIIYFLARMRNMMKNTKGARGDMSTIELVKNWQEQKANEVQRQNDLHEKAKEAARPEIDRILTEKYKQEAIAEATATKGDKFKQNLKSGLGLDSDKIFSDERINRMVGKSSQGDGLKGAVGSGSGDMFSQEKLDRMTGKGTTMDPDRIKAASGNLNWTEGMRKGIESKSKFEGVERALGRDTDRTRKVSRRFDRR